MPYEPTFPHPYLEAIDINSDGGNNFQCVINPRDKITEYEITISSINGSEMGRISGSLDSNTKQQNKKLIADSGISTKIDISSVDSPLPFQGKANSDKSIFIVNVPTGHESLKLSQGAEYFWSIKLSADDGSSVISKDFYFTTATQPNLTLAIPSMVTSNRIKLAATYSQAENLMPAYYRFTLYNRAKEVYTTDDIFASDIAFEYDKLINGEDYELELTVVLDNGVEVIKNYFFSVSYNESDSFLASSVESHNNDTYVFVDYSKQMGAHGVLEDDSNLSFGMASNSAGEVSEDINCLYLRDGQSIYWNKVGDRTLDFEDTNLILHWHARQGFNGAIFEIIDEDDSSRNIKVSFSNGEFCYIAGQQDPQYYNIQNTNISDAWYLIYLTPEGIEYIKDDNVIEVSFSTIYSIPSYSGTLKYTGDAQSPVWINYDPEKLQIGGTTSAKNIGTYVATFTPNNGWMWEDGTFDAKSVNWSIEVPGATLNDWSWKAISNIAESGQAQNYFSVGDCKEIVIPSRSYVNDNPITGTYLVYIIGFNHNGAQNTIDFGTFKTLDMTEICLGGYDVVAYDRPLKMHHEIMAVNWRDCDMRYSLLGSTDRQGENASWSTAITPVPNTLMAAFPSDLREVMKPISVYTNNNVNNAWEMPTLTIDYLPLMSEFEVFGTAKYSRRASYQKQYQYYSDGNFEKRAKKAYVYHALDHKFVFKNDGWWLRSLGWETYMSDIAETTDFCYCDYAGYARCGQVGTNHGIAPIFRV